MVNEFEILGICAIFGANAAFVYFAKNKFQSQIEKSMNMKDDNNNNNKKLAITKTLKSKENF
ncbi:MAG TPA: hypothetical protein VH796_03775 [Nitrososphaeraceae archaeon]|jgi:hypothetical protein